MSSFYVLTGFMMGFMTAFVIYSVFWLFYLISNKEETEYYNDGTMRR